MRSNDFAGRMMNDMEAVQNKIPLLSEIFAVQMGRAVVDLRKHSNFTQMKRAEIQKYLAYEDWRADEAAKQRNGAYQSDLDRVFSDPDQPEAFIFAGRRIVARDKTDFFGILSEKVHEELHQVEPYKNVAGVVATRVNLQTGKKEVLLVKGANDAWYFPGGKEDKKYPDDTGSDPEGLEAAIRRETGEELGRKYEGGLRRGPSMFGIIGGKRFLFHTFYADGIADPSNWIDISGWKDAEDRTTQDVEWTDHPFTDNQGNPRKLTEHARYVLEGLFNEE